MDTIDIVILVVVMTILALVIYDTKLFVWWINDIAALRNHDEALTKLRSHEGDVRRRPLGNIYLMIKGIF